MMVDAGSEKGVIDTQEKEIIQNLFDFDNLTVGEFLTHRTEVSVLWMDESEEEWERTIHETRHSRFPVCDETTDNVIGVLSAKAYFRLREKSRENVMREAVQSVYFVPETVRADVLFRQMKTTRNHFAVVLDEYGGTLGIVTMNDLLEQLVGDLDDDMLAPAKADEIVKIDSGTWRIAGTAPLSDVAETLGVALPFTEYDTFGGLVFGVYGSVPDDGAQFEIDVNNLHVKVTDISDHRLESAMVCLTNKTEKTKESEEEAD